MWHTKDMVAVSGPMPTRPPLVGRTAECRLIAASVAAAAAGESTFLIVRGPAGVGKTRLAHEALDAAAKSGFTAAIGRADELDERVALSPIIEALTPLVRAETQPGRRRLAGELPQLGAVFSGVGLPVPSPMKDATLERRRIIDATAHLIDHFASRKPLALLIDDVQAADEVTLALLDRLSGLAVTGKLLVLCTASTDGSTALPASRLYRRFSSSAWRADNIDVVPLGPAAAAALFDSVAQRQLDSALRDAAIENCAGIPFFLAAMAGHLSGSADIAPVTETDDALALPGTVQDEIQLRLNALSADALTVARLLAVGGTGCAFGTLLACSSLGRSPQALALAELEERNLVVAGPGPGEFSLAHGLLRSAVLAGMPRAAIYRRHAAFAAALAAEEPTNLRAAEHVLRSGPVMEPDAALPILVHAAHRARAVGAVDTAIRFFESALTCARGLLQSSHCAAIHYQIADLSDLVLRPAEARKHARAATDLYRSLGDDSGVSRALRIECRLAWASGDVTTALWHLGEARRAHARLAPCADDVEQLVLEATVASRLGDASKLALTAGAMQAASRRFPSARLTIESALTSAAVSFNRTDFVRAAAQTADAAAATSDGTDPTLVIRAYDQLSIFALANGELARSSAATGKSLDASRKLGATGLQLWPRLRTAIVDLHAGRLDEAIRECQELCDLAESVHSHRGQVSVLATLSLALTRRGSLDEAADAIGNAYRLKVGSLSTDIHTSAPLVTARVALAVAAGDVATAATVGAQLTNLGTGAHPLISAAVYGEALWRAGRSAEALQLACAVRDVRSCSTPLASAVYSWIRGLCASDGTRDLSRAADGFAACALPFEQAVCLVAASERLSGDEAVGAAAAGLALADMVGARAVCLQARTVLRAHGVVPSRGRPSSPDSNSLLSPREREIAELAAAGNPTSAIAARLYISPRTVTTHLERIYAKTGVHSRIALAHLLADPSALMATAPAQRPTENT